ncbi:phospholipid-binding protein [Dictyostelium discoideum AX4]|uniref:copine B n=1 Tax=Dictyostelium discoideum AX4 TaxID=352472 RepID=UPI00004E30F0|nr:phospholipid-binding protein [Dictyostelium discoideum AX4]XP_645029.1 phospholipid-binding protein [Dictyostelium discoideum AX4]EAL70459.1 phospholipid-binding protein [Dictyostelium discoideum AX4]EAL71075.1 phospholipid-binding protein [Dictyostelium discoideum AX4]|eukprot:XP_644384.1 phospholipid-binding protein [Dictyostelium discoideum AX4]
MTTPISLSKPRVELRFKCSHLKNLGKYQYKSDPLIMVFDKRGEHGESIFVGQTEKINNNLNPEFKKSVIIDYHFENIQNLSFIVVDIDKEIKRVGDLEGNDIIGQYTTTLGNIISKPNKKVISEIKHKGKETGVIEITAEEIRETGHNFLFKINGTKLDKKDLFTSDPYFKIYKTSSSGNVLVYQSVVIKNTLNPNYEPVMMKLEELNNGDMFRELVFEFWDHDSVGEHDFIGLFTTNADTVLKGITREFPLINAKKAAKKSGSYKNSGVITFTDCRLVGQPTFIDYLSGGCEINLMVAIDCTASNGSPSTSTSLHYHTPSHPSQYAKSIFSVGSVLAPYDSDGNIEVLGFGGIHRGSTSHCFQFGSKKEVRGVEGVLLTYGEVIPSMSLSYPTNFKDIISYAAKKSLDGVTSKSQKYTILLILTDGEISDMNETVHEIVKASKQSPLSIVIIGIGEATFDNMNRLDGDDGNSLTDSSGQTATRDIVQFVPFNNFSANPEALATETLREIPQQLLGFMNQNNYLPMSHRLK